MHNSKSYQGLRFDLLKHIHKKPSIVLDVGCNIGKNGDYLKTKYGRNVKVIGIDYNEQAIKQARLLLDKAFTFDLNDLNGFKKILDELDHFDVILLGDVLEHLLYPVDIVNLLYKKLTDEGIIIISVPNSCYYISILNILRLKWPRNKRGIYDKTHIKIFCKKNLFELQPQNSKMRIVSRNLRLKETSGTRFDKFLIPILINIPYLKEFFTFQYIITITKK